MSKINSLVTGQKISNCTRILWLFSTFVLSHLEILMMLSLQEEEVGYVGGISTPPQWHEGRLEKREVMIIEYLHIVYIDILCRTVAFGQK